MPPSLIFAAALALQAPAAPLAADACVSGAATAQEGTAVARSPCASSSVDFEARSVSMGAMKGITTSIWSGAPDHRRTLTASPDGRRIAYTVRKGASKGWLALAPFGVGRNDQAKAIVDGVEGPGFDMVSRPDLMPELLSVYHLLGDPGMRIR